MTFIFSKHALEQMALRNISKEMVEDVIHKPEQTIRERGITIYQAVRTLENENKYLIRIFVNNEKNPEVIITVYRTSKISKYHEG